MKLKLLTVVVVAGSWACSSALGEKEKYIKIDPEKGKPDYASETDAKTYVGMAADKDLCSVAFKPVKITKPKKDENGEIIKDENGHPKSEEVKGFSFDCSQSKECKEKNKDANAAKNELINKIAAQEKIINPPPKSKAEKKKEEEANKNKSKEVKEAEAKEKKAKKEQAEKTKGELEEKLKKFKPECSMKFYTAAGGDDKIDKTQLTPDEIKAKKIEYIVCPCQKIEIPN